MHRTLFGLAAIIAFGRSHPSTSTPLSGVPLVEPEAFGLWPSVAEEPIEVGPTPWRLCRGPTPEQKLARKADEEANGAHASHSIIVRISPNTEEAFRSGATLPSWSVVVKEKHSSHSESGSFDAYALMIKHDAGYDAANGDWVWFIRYVNDFIRVPLRQRRCMKRRWRKDETTMTFGTFPSRQIAQMFAASTPISTWKYSANLRII